MRTLAIIADVRRRATRRTWTFLGLAMCAFLVDLLVGRTLSISSDTVNLVAACLGGIGSYILVAPALASFQLHQTRLRENLQRATKQTSKASPRAPDLDGDELMGETDGLVDEDALTDERIDLLQAEVIELIETVTIDDSTIAYYVDGLLLVSASFVVLGVAAAVNLFL